MAVIKAMALPGTGYVEDPIEIDVTEGPIVFLIPNGGTCHVTDIDKVDELQKALAVWVAWKRLYDS